jgi:GNAT superfamily N-acetyltransferase
MSEVRIRALPEGSPKLETVGALDVRIFPDDDPYPLEGARWWLAEGPGGEALGYAGAKLWSLDGFVYLARAGVVASARGQGLQKRLIKARVSWAKRIGAKGCYTYTIGNPASANSLISKGFRAWEPLYRWGGNNASYWILRF